MLEILEKRSHMFYYKGWRQLEGFRLGTVFTNRSDSNATVLHFCRVDLRRADGDLLKKLVMLQHARQVVDSLRKSSDLSNSPLRVFHLFQVVEVLVIDPDAPLEAAALGHFHVHGADVLLAIVLTFLPQSAKTTE